MRVTNQPGRQSPSIVLLPAQVVSPLSLYNPPSSDPGTVHHLYLWLVTPLSFTTTLLWPKWGWVLSPETGHLETPNIFNILITGGALLYFCLYQMDVSIAASSIQSHQIFSSILTGSNFKRFHSDFNATLHNNSRQVDETKNYLFPSFILVSFLLNSENPIVISDKFEFHTGRGGCWRPFWKAARQKDLSCCLAIPSFYFAIIIIVDIIIIKRICHWNRLYVNEAKNHNK